MSRIHAAASAAILLFVGATPSPAQTSDHLKCYKVGDSHNYQATANLDTNALQAAAFPGETNCRIVVKSKEFCVPVAKTRFVDFTNPKEAPEVELAGQDLQNDYLCYKVRCDKPTVLPPATQLVVDQFGTHTVSGFRTAKVCTPAVKIASGTLEDPVPFSAILKQTFVPGTFGTPNEVFIDLYTSLDAEYRFTGITSITTAPGMHLVGVEVPARSDCAGGSVALGPSGGCGQIWSLRLTLDPGVCTLNGNHAVSLRYGCNTALGDCSLVNFALPDHVVNFSTTSDNFCP